MVLRVNREFNFPLRYQAKATHVLKDLLFLSNMCNCAKKHTYRAVETGAFILKCMSNNDGPVIKKF